MLTVTRKHAFSAAHRLYDYNGTCERLHGHNYAVDLTLGGKSLNSQGMIMDFAHIKRLLLTALDEAWDHRTLLYDQDPLCTALSSVLHDGSVCAVPFNPTAENMARYLGEHFFPELLTREKLTDLWVHRITIYETEHNYATWQPTCEAAGQ